MDLYLIISFQPDGSTSATATNVPGSSRRRIIRIDVNGSELESVEIGSLIRPDRGSRRIIEQRSDVIRRTSVSGGGPPDDGQQLAAGVVLLGPR